MPCLEFQLRLEQLRFTPLYTRKKKILTSAFPCEYTNKLHQASLLSSSTTYTTITMAFKALSSDLLPNKTLSQAADGWRSKVHPLCSRNGRNYIRSQFSISDWLVIGSCFQALIILISPYSVALSLAPNFILAAFKIARTILVTRGLIANPYMNGVRIGRTTAVFPEGDGGFDRKKDDSFGGDGVCIMLLSTKCNQCVLSCLSNYI